MLLSWNHSSQLSVLLMFYYKLVVYLQKHVSRMLAGNYGSVTLAFLIPFLLGTIFGAFTYLALLRAKYTRNDLCILGGIATFTKKLK